MLRLVYLRRAKLTWRRFIGHDLRLVRYGLAAAASVLLALGTLTWHRVALETASAPAPETERASAPLAAPANSAPAAEREAPASSRADDTASRSIATAERPAETPTTAPPTAHTRTIAEAPPPPATAARSSGTLDPSMRPPARSTPPLFRDGRPVAAALVPADSRLQTPQINWKDERSLSLPTGASAIRDERPLVDARRVALRDTRDLAPAQPALEPATSERVAAPSVASASSPPQSTPTGAPPASPAASPPAVALAAAPAAAPAAPPAATSPPAAPPATTSSQPVRPAPEAPVVAAMQAPPSSPPTPTAPSAAEAAPAGRAPESPRPATCEAPAVSGEPLAAGRMALVITAPCLAERPVEIRYADIALSRQLDGTGRLAMNLDLFAGSGHEVTVRLSDGTERRLPANGHELDRITKVAVIWRAPVNLDLHVLEYGARHGEDGHLWARAASTVEAARRATDAAGRGRGFISSHDGAATIGDKIEVYTLLHSERQASGSIGLVIDYESRGSLPAGDTCGDGANAEVDFVLVTFARDGRTTRQHGALARIDCGVALTTEQRLAVGSLPDLRVRPLR